MVLLAQIGPPSFGWVQLIVVVAVVVVLWLIIRTAVRSAMRRKP